MKPIVCLFFLLTFFFSESKAQQYIWTFSNDTISANTYLVGVYAEFKNPFISLKDSLGTDLSDQVTGFSPLVASRVADYTLTYYFADRWNHGDSYQIKAVVRDTTPPVITLFGPDTICWNKDFVDPMGKANDNYDQHPSVISDAKLLPSKLDSCAFITYTALDSSGNMAKTRRTVCPCITGIGEVPNSSAYIYPNPANDELRIETSAKHYFIHFYNSLGQIVFESSLGEETINLNPFAEGVYYLRLQGENDGLYFSQKVIIKR